MKKDGSLEDRFLSRREIRQTRVRMHTGVVTDFSSVSRLLLS
jgi:hypothetical protein